MVREVKNDKLPTAGVDYMLKRVIELKATYKIENEKESKDVLSSG